MPFAMKDRYDFLRTEWREVGAVYGILDRSGAVIYIGQTDDLKRRMSEHRCDRTHCMHRYDPTWVVVEVLTTERSRLAREQQLISEYDPPCNAD